MEPGAKTLLERILTAAYSQEDQQVLVHYLKEDYPRDEKAIGKVYDCYQKGDGADRCLNLVTGPRRFVIPLKPSEASPFTAKLWRSLENDLAKGGFAKGGGTESLENVMPAGDTPEIKAQRTSQITECYGRAGDADACLEELFGAQPGVITFTLTPEQCNRIVSWPSLGWSADSMAVGIANAIADGSTDETVQKRAKAAGEEISNIYRGAQNKNDFKRAFWALAVADYIS